MIKEISYQTDAVNELVEKTIRLLNASGSRKKLVFKAPTGSGKTVMASRMLDELTSQLADEGREVAIIWIAPNKLHQQSYLKMKNYFTETRVFSPVTYDELDHSAGGYIHPGEVFFVNWESINKNKNVIVRETERSASLYDITRRTQEEYGLPLIVVIDEEHLFGGRDAKQSEKVLKNINPKVEIRISATPDTMPDEMVTVSREQVIKEEMIKDGITINPMVSDPESGLSENEYLLEQALAKREEIKAAYERLNRRINPLLLIQLPNDNDETLDEEERSIIDMVKTRLETVHDITTKNGRLAIWLSNDKQKPDGLENDHNMTEVLLFKQAIALGWDCPRAAVLLIFREIKSTSFGIQTVGRIMRMPEQKYYPDPLLNHGWVYTNLSRDRIEIVAEDMNYVSKSLAAYRRQNFTNVSLPSVYSERLSKDRNRLGPDFWPVLVEAFNDRWFKCPIQQEFDFSPFEDEEDDDNEERYITDKYDSGFLDDIVRNRKQAEQIDHVDFNMHNVQVNIVSDLDITGEAGTTLIEENKRKKFARNQEELNKMMTEFCENLLPGFEKISVTTLRGYLFQLMEEYLGFVETEAVKIINYKKNKDKFKSIIGKAVSEYVKIINARKEEAKKRAFKTYQWEVPEAREYNETANSVVPEVKNHALMPFIRLNNASSPERIFEEFLENHSDCIDWWYKNGDEGRQHYAITYTKTDGTKAPFYVDFVIRMKNGQIFLFDTKSVEGNTEATNKHNALIDYMADEGNARLHLKGGIIIEDNGLWKYSLVKIENTNDLADWETFFPDNYKE